MAQKIRDFLRETKTTAPNEKTKVPPQIFPPSANHKQLRKIVRQFHSKRDSRTNIQDTRRFCISLVHIQVS